MPLQSETLRDLFATVLRGAGTLAGARVYTPRDWPVTDPDMPCLLIDCPKTHRKSRGTAGFPSFHAIAFLTVDARLKGATETAARSDAATLEGQVLTALLTSYDIVAQVEEFPEVLTEVAISADARQHYAEMRIQVACRYPEDFEPIITDTLEGIDLHADLAAPFDAAGTYPDPAFPAAVQPAPRASGPDGRDEGAATFNFTTP